MDSTASKYGLYYILRNEEYHYEYDQNGNYICYVTRHNIIRANNDEALNKSNKIYIPLRNTLELSALKARAITRDNKIIDFDENNIKELEDENSGYKILAIEGAEVGGEIEYFYTLKTYASNFMSRIIQSSYPVRKLDFKLTCPDHIEYDFKLYNDSNNKVVQTDDSEDYNQYELSIEHIKPLFNEDFAAYDDSKIRLEFKLAYNNKAGSHRLFTWSDAGKQIYAQIYDLSNEEKKSLSKYIKKLGLKGDPITAFRQAEHKIKTTIFYQERVPEGADEITTILANKYASSKGFTRLFAGVLNHLNIQHEIILTSDRNDRRFDRDFDTWNYLDEYLIYVNSADQFMSPKDMPLRLGTIPFNYIGSDALFVRAEPIQDFVFPVTRIGHIPAPSYKENYDNLDIEVSFNESLDENTVNVTRSFLGYGAQFYKMALIALEEERKQLVLKDIIKYLAPDAEIEALQVVQDNIEFDTWIKPFTIQGTFKSSGYIESAGDVILFKAGDLIGPQSEMYQENERTLQVVNDFNRGYLRRITVNIPDGYSIQNPDDLIINEQVVENERMIFNFESSYEIVGQQLKIEIIEFYDELYYPVEKFEPFKKVINAAADWNKIVLVMTE